MKPIEFHEQNVIFAKDQPEYLPLPAFKDENGDVVMCFELTEEETKYIVETKQIWLGVKTFNNPLQPIFLTALKGDLLQIEQTILKTDQDKEIFKDAILNPPKPNEKLKKAHENHKNNLN